MELTERETAVEELLAYMQWLQDHGVRQAWMAEFLCFLVPYVGEDQADYVRVLAAKLPQRIDRVRVMARLIRQIKPDVQPWVMEEVRRLTDTMRQPDLKAQALIVLATAVPQ